ncbi:MULTISPECIES: SDR family NAD(P)-dependent oxidoreductase [Arthrobacter]|uniref:SDR family oxidoreductase n=1 Tax=Arthrobacter caoxuetaonis TaxID=2886935 RepID=A0A9X1MFL8_9MICC|nr:MULTISPECIES: SDR family oxidoreductase [Arthrobacter]MCC3281590.1 SDR family oxidoreductase [Arthrobacter caoxuetaonis]MCC3298741.1 SDR family oxidoreductase [Arthrobacter caoxuetaonis]MCC9194967.1 SDR family oxidoreductase [Arthrobacter sp. zg-Y916]USQ57474.1 SDR family oxidoreductase [Arthrobacter caoxuetaonis]
MQLQNKTAIITGGAGGIGQGIVRRFLAEGAKVAVVDIDQAQGDKLLAELDGQGDVIFIAKDISKEESTKEIVAETVERFGGLDVLVNNAHASKQAPIMETTQEMWDLSFNTGTMATFHLMRAAYPELKKTRGSIINFASGAGMKGLPNQVTYAAAKEAIRAISRTAANEWAKDGIRVNVVSPIALTPGIAQWSQAFPEAFQEVVDGIPLGRLGDPETDIAPIVVFLASEQSQYMTGQTLMADGGSIKIY